MKIRLILFHSSPVLGCAIIHKTRLNESESIAQCADAVYSKCDRLLE